MFDWLKRRAAETPGAVDAMDRLKRLAQEADGLSAAGHRAEARARYEEVLRADPKDLYVIYQLATLLQKQGETGEAQRVCEQGLALDADQIGLRARRAAICHDCDDHLAALADYLRVFELDPEYPGIDAHLADEYCFLGRGREAVDAFDRALARDPESTILQSNRLFVLNYFKLLNRDALFEEHRKWGAVHEARLRPLWQPFDNDRSLDRRLRIGYVSPDLRNHAVAFFIEGVLREHDRQAFEIHCFDVSPFPEDHVTARLRSYVDAWHRVGDLDDDAIAAMIRAERIDVLVDLSGHTAHNRLLVFAKRPAPVQVSWFGYMNTTGLTAIDYRITDAALDPPGQSERYYTESLFHQPAMACFSPSPESPDIGPPAFEQTGHVTFASVNQWPKVTAEVKSLWGGILRDAPAARLIIVARGADNPQLREEIEKQFTMHGAASKQIEIVQTLPLAGFLELFRKIDVALDPFPYGGGTTTLHSIWMGVPVLTLAGDTEMSRSTPSILGTVGLDVFVAADKEDYRNKALALAADPSPLRSIRADLRERFRVSGLMDALGLARNLEKTFKTMSTRFIETNVNNASARVRRSDAIP